MNSCCSLPFCTECKVNCAQNCMSQGAGKCRKQCSAGWTTSDCVCDSNYAECHSLSIVLWLRKYAYFIQINFVVTYCGHSRLEDGWCCQHLTVRLLIITYDVVMHQIMVSVETATFKSTNILLTKITVSAEAYLRHWFRSGLGWPAGFTYLLNVSSCYKLITTQSQLSQIKGARLCFSLNSHLAYIIDNLHQATVASFLSQSLPGSGLFIFYNLNQPFQLNLAQEFSFARFEFNY
jgi:hypothetical protein